MVVYSYYPLGETRVQREAEALVAAGFEVDVICLRKDGEPARERYRGVAVHRLAMGLDKRNLIRQFVNYVRFTVRAGVRLTRLHRARPFGSVQVHNLPDFLVFSALWPKVTGAAVILDLHDLMPEFFAGRFGPGGAGWLSRAIRLQERAACRFADHVITVSEHWRSTLIARGVPAAKCTVVMNVADEAIFAPVAPPPAGDGLHLIYHGTVTRRYGLDLAIEAVGLVRGEIPQIRLSIIGRGDDVAPLRELRERLGLHEEVLIEDRMFLAEDLPRLLAEADLGIVPYRDDVFTDGLLPTKLMEYAAMGMPCIAARTTAIAETFEGSMVSFFRPGDAGDLADRIRELYADPGLRGELAGKSRIFTQRYNWTEIGAAYVGLVGGLVASSRAPRR